MRDNLFRSTVVLLGVMACGFTVACSGDSPTGPGGPIGQPNAFLTGRTGLNITSHDGVCTPRTPAFGSLGPFVLGGVAVIADGQDFLGRPDRPLGDAEVRFRVTPSTATESHVTGTARGTLYDLLSALQFPNPAHVTFSGANGAADAELTGLYHPQLRGASGRIAGSIVFTDHQGGTMACTEAVWVLVAGIP